MNLHHTTIASELKIRLEQVSSAAALFNDGNTIPFIARYRKEATGGLDEEQLRRVRARLEQLEKLAERRDKIIESIKSQGKMTPDLQRRLAAAATLTELEDIYLPFRPKRVTRAGEARKKGLQDLANMILLQDLAPSNMREAAGRFLGPDVPSIKDALAGARDIAAETIAEHPAVRRVTREKALTWGSLHTQRLSKAEDPRGVYENYYDFELRLDRLRPHQVLAINRGEKEKVLRVQVLTAERDWREAVENVFRPQPDSIFSDQLRLAAEDAANRLLLPAIERDVRRSLTERADNHAITVFADNLRALLSQPPLAGYTVMGIDPGFRTGCKVVVVSPTSVVLGRATIYPHPPQKEWQPALDALAGLVKKHGVHLVAIGNGTASRETEQLVAELIAGEKNTAPLQYLVVNEAGASVYSASPLARRELPDMDVSMRGAVSIARRVQDPLAELVKIDPKSIGVGMYQHDVDQKALAGALEDVVESVVNQVGVDVNTASPALLGYVAGVGPKLAENIAAHREANGPFPDREALKQVAGLGEKTFEQAAGFLRIRDGRNGLDASAIHPESYPAAEALLENAGLDAGAAEQARRNALEHLLQQVSLPALAERLGIGKLTLEDILEQLARPGRDPREELPPPVLRSDVMSMGDLVPGMVLKGTVRNVVDFGAFIDIGVKQDGLLHRSQIPKDAPVQVGQVLEVQILNVDNERGRIGLGMAGP